MENNRDTINSIVKAILLPEHIDNKDIMVKTR